MPGYARRFLLAAGLAAILISIVTVFAPLTIYGGNQTEFTVSIVEVLLVFLPYSLVLIALCGLMGVLLGEDGNARLVSMLGGLCVLFWLQNNILVWDYGSLDGRSIEWTDNIWRGILDSCIWAAVILVSITMYRKVGRLFVTMAAGVISLQLVSLLLTTGSIEELPDTSFEVKSELGGRDAMFNFSKNENVIQIIMDGLQTDIFEAMVAGDAGAAYREQLQGFTVFRENLGAYPYTEMSIPALLSGRLFRNEMPVDEFIDATLNDNTILNAAVENGYEVDIAAQVALKNVYSKGQHTNAYGIQRGSHASADDYIINDSAKLLDLALFRVLPHFGKALVHRDELWVFQGMVRQESYLQMQYFADIAFLQELSSNMRVEREAPVYKLMHLMLSHRPTVGEEDCSFDKVHNTSRETVTKQATCSLRSVLDVLSRLKEFGLYDSSTIILMADHGAWVPIDGLDASKQGVAIDPLSMAMAMPLLAIKPANAEKEYSTSAALTSISDVPATLSSLLGLDAKFPGDSVFAIDEREPRTRLHHTYLFGPNKNATGYLLPMHEKIVTGSLYDPNSWEAGQKYLPNTDRSNLPLQD